MNDFFSKVFELWGGNISSISDSLYDYGIYSTIGMVMFFVCIAIPLIYYKLWDPIGLNKPKHWAIIMFSSALFVTLVGFLYAFNEFNYEDLGFEFFDYLSWILTLFLYSSLFVSIFSILVFRFISTNNRKNPV